MGNLWSYWSSPKSNVDPKPLSFRSKGETECQRVLEAVFKNQTFKKVRPKFLINPRTKCRLELDLYSEQLGLAIEYNGRQHYEYEPRFHRDQQAFIDQVYRDTIKQKDCPRNNVVLITVPYYVTDIETYLLDELDKYKQFQKAVDAYKKKHSK